MCRRHSNVLIEKFQLYVSLRLQLDRPISDNGLSLPHEKEKKKKK